MRRITAQFTQLELVNKQTLGDEVKKLNIELGKFIRKDKDSLIIFKSRQEKWLEKEFWGIEDDKTSNFF